VLGLTRHPGSLANGPVPAKGKRQGVQMRELELKFLSEKFHARLISLCRQRG